MRPRLALFCSSVALLGGFVFCVGSDERSSGTPPGADSGGPGQGNDAGSPGPGSDGSAPGDAEASAPRTGNLSWFFSVSAFTRVASVVVRPDGHVFAVGSLLDASVVLGEAPNQTTLTRIGVGSNLLVIELDPAGKLVWAKNYGAAGVSVGGSAVSVSGNNVIVSGTFSEGVFEGLPDYGQGEQNPLVLAINSAATDKPILWKRSFMKSLGSFGTCDALSPSSNGRIAVGCSFEGTSSVPRYGGGPLERGPFAAAGLVVVLTEADGNAVWETAINRGRPASIHYDGTDAVVVGYIDGTEATEVRSNLTVTPTGAGNGNFLFKLTPTGASWGRSFASSTTIGGQSIHSSMDPDGNLVAFGGYVGTMDPGGGSITATTGDLYLVRYPSDGGVPSQQQTIGGARNDSAFAVTVDKAGDVTFAGQLVGVDAGAFSVPTPASGTDSLLVMAKVGPAGAPLWLKSYPATTTINLSNAIGALAPTPNNGVVFAGAIPGHLELSATAVVNGVNPFNHHSFIAGFDP